MFRWLSITPLGVPVVPPVYWSMATSSGFDVGREGDSFDPAGTDSISRRKSYSGGRFWTVTHRPVSLALMG